MALAGIFSDLTRKKFGNLGKDNQRASIKSPIGQRETFAEKSSLFGPGTEALLKFRLYFAAFCEPERAQQAHRQPVPHSSIKASVLEE